MKVAKAIVLTGLLGAVLVAQAYAAGPGAFYQHSQSTGLARAFCRGHTLVVGGGGFVESPSRIGFKPEKLRQTYPISDPTGVIAFANTAIGYQVASSDFTDTVVAFSICAGPALEAAIDNVQYISSQSVGVARAFCPASTVLLGGGAFVETPEGGGFKEEKLRQSYPISDATGVIAFGTTGIGWQGASSDFTDTVVAFAICATRSRGSALVANYEFGQGVGVARGFCTAGTTLTGGGGFVEDLVGGGLVDVSLRQTFPISDATGVIAHGTQAIGWQTASSDFNDTVVAIAICASY